MSVVTLWVNYYRPIVGSCGHAYSTRELADQMASRDRIACIPVTFEIEDHVNVRDSYTDSRPQQ